MIPAKPAAKPDIAALLAPITEGSPCGEYLLYEGTYDRIKEARREDDVSLERGIWKHNMKRAEWPAVESMCVRALEEYTKDLQIAAWLLEAWLHLRGFAGLRDGLELLDVLIQKYWDEIYPPIQDDDLDFRLGPMIWLNERIPTEVKLVPITQPETSDVPQYSWADWEIASRSETPVKASKPEPAPDKMTQARFQQSALVTATPYLVTQVQDLEAAIEACNRLELTLDQKCSGQQATSLQQISTALEPIHGLLDSLLNQRDVNPALQGEEGGSAGSILSGGGFDTRTASSEGTVRTRAEAYRRLSEAADFLMRTEPHSPTPYLVKRAISWGSMSLEELLPQLIQNSNELSELSRLLQLDKKKR